eukprot:sb/3472444/
MLPKEKGLLLTGIALGIQCFVLVSGFSFVLGFEFDDGVMTITDVAVLMFCPPFVIMTVPNITAILLYCYLPDNRYQGLNRRIALFAMSIFLVVLATFQLLAVFAAMLIYEFANIDGGFFQVLPFVILTTCQTFCFGFNINAAYGCRLGGGVNQVVVLTQPDLVLVQ